MNNYEKVGENPNVHLKLRDLPTDVLELANNIQLDRFRKIDTNVRVVDASRFINWELTFQGFAFWHFVWKVKSKEKEVNSTLKIKDLPEGLKLLALMEQEKWRLTHNDLARGTGFDSEIFSELTDPGLFLISDFYVGDNFPWNKSPQGFEFWDNVHFRYNTNGTQTLSSYGS